MTTPTFTTPPVAPSRQAPSTFSALSDAFLSYIVTFQGELVTAVSWIATQVSTVAAYVVTASAAAATATSAAGAAVAASGATVWVSGASYTANTDAVISPVNQQTYRAKTTHSGVTTDPSLDTTNWNLVGVDGEAIRSEAKLFSLFIGG
jgi:hypothetical protein